MKKPQQQKGFTLIELIIVIIILGILSVTAAPRFLDLSSDARESTMQGVLGAVQASSQIAHAALLVRTATADEPIMIEGVVIETEDDEAPDNYAFAEDICDLIGLTTDDGDVEGIGTQTPVNVDSLNCAVANNTLTITDTAAEAPATCIVTYQESNPPVINSDLDGC